MLSYEVSKGHLKWKVADVSRRLKVSRSLIYYHFGSSKQEILDSCFEIVAEEFYGLNNDFRGLADFENRVLEKSLIRTQKIYLRTPAIITFYHRWRQEQSPMQKRMLEMERRYQAKLLQAFPHLTKDEMLAVHAAMHGVVTGPFVSAAAARVVAEMLRPMLVGKTDVVK